MGFHPLRATIKNFPDLPHKSLGGVFLLCKQSVLPSIPKSGLTTLPQDWEIWNWVWNQDWWLSVLENPTENDVITTERDRQRNLDEKTWLCVSDVMCNVSCRRCYWREKKPLTLLTHSVISNIGCLATGNTYISSRTGPLFRHVCSSVTAPNSVRATIKNDSLWSPKVNIWHSPVLCLPLKAAFSNSGWSQVSSTSPLLCCVHSQTPDLLVGIPPQCQQQRYVALWSPNKVETAPCSWQQVPSLRLVVCCWVCISVCVRKGGDPTLPLTICSFSWGKKKIRDKGSVCAGLSAYIARNLSHLQLALSWQASLLPRPS